jgi:hypothetical protein
MRRSLTTRAILTLTMTLAVGCGGGGSGGNQDAGTKCNSTLACMGGRCQ